MKLVKLTDMDAVNPKYVNRISLIKHPMDVTLNHVEVWIEEETGIDVYGKSLDEVKNMLEQKPASRWEV